MGSIRLPAESASAGVARRFVVDAVRGTVGPVDIEFVALLTSELVTNAIVHAGTPIGLVVRGIHGCVQIEVSDGSDQMPVVVDQAVASESGHGMSILVLLSKDWGVIPTAEGKTVWFSLPAGVLAPSWNRV